MKLAAFSDQHGNLDFALPDVDLLLCAGDVAPNWRPRHPSETGKQTDWLNNKWMPWLHGKRCLATFGNHDFLRKHIAPKPFKVDELVEVDGVKIWFSPWSPEFCGWAWMDLDHDLGFKYAQIPLGTNIIVSHTPPYGYGDLIPDYLARDGEDPHVGSKALLEAINRVKPQYVVCGHIHNSRGEYMHGDAIILNVAVVNEQYERVYEPVEFEM